MDDAQVDPDLDEGPVDEAAREEEAADERRKAAGRQRWEAYRAAKAVKE
jgi:hypothetical protein